MDPGEVGARDGSTPDRGSGPVDEVDDAVGETGFLQEPHVVVGGERGGRGRFPDDGAAHERRRRGEISADAGEVERTDGQDEALERTVLQTVPDARG